MLFQNDAHISYRRRRRINTLELKDDGKTKFTVLQIFIITKYL